MHAILLNYVQIKRWNQRLILSNKTKMTSPHLGTVFVQTAGNNFIVIAGVWVIHGLSSIVNTVHVVLLKGGIVGEFSRRSFGSRAVMQLVRMAALLIAQCAQPYSNRIKIKLVIMCDAAYHTTSDLTRKKYKKIQSEHAFFLCTQEMMVS